MSRRKPRKGWIKLWRKLQLSTMYENLDSKQRDVMMQLIMMADWEPEEWEWQGEIFNTEEGQFVTSLDSIKENCAKDVSTQNIRTALKKLEKWQFLTNESTKTGRLITIVNWGTYQNQDDETNKETNKDLTKTQQRPNKDLTSNKNTKQLNNIKKVKNKPIVQEELFNEFWDLFDNKQAKPKVIAIWNKLTPEIRTKIMVTVPKYLDHLKSTGYSQAMATTWLNNERWDDEYKQPQASQPTPEQTYPEYVSLDTRSPEEKKAESELYKSIVKKEEQRKALGY